MPTILIVDGQIAMHRLLEALLEDAGCILAFADSPSMALERLRRGGIDLVLLDSGDERGSSIAFLCNLRKIDNDVVGLVMTRFHNEEIMLKSLRAGAFDYIRKPFTAEEIESLIERALDERKRRLKAKETARATAPIDYGELDNKIAFILERESFLSQSEEELAKRTQELLEREAEFEKRVQEAGIAPLGKTSRKVQPAIEEKSTSMDDLWEQVAVEGL